MKRLSILPALCLLFTPVTWGLSPDNRIKSGECTVTIEFTGDNCAIPDSLDIAIIYPSLFDHPFETNTSIPDKNGDTYTAVIPLETKEALGGLIVGKGEERYSVGYIELDQDKPLHIIGRFMPDGKVIYTFSDTHGLNAYSHAPDNTNITPLVSASMMRFSSYREGDTDDEPTFSPTDKGRWDVISSKLDTMFLVQRDYALGGHVMPEATKPWLENNLKYWFAGNWRLPYKNRASRTFGWGDDISIPGDEYFSFLNDIDYSSELLNHTTVFGPYHFLTKILENYPGLTPIGESPVKEWQDETSRKLATAIPQPSPLLLELLAATSYVMQYDDGTILTPTQTANIKAGFSPDMSEILLRRNDALKQRLLRTVSVADLFFDLKNYIDSAYQGHPVVVDLWNTWCSPCLSAHKSTDKIITSPEYADIVFLYIADESSPEEEWRKYAPTIGGKQIRISRSSSEKLIKEYGVEGYPTYLIFNREHVPVTKTTGFPGIKEYTGLLDSIK